MNHQYVYALRCESDKYYVGKTRNPRVRISFHSLGNGAEWTKSYAPISVLFVRPMVHPLDEEIETLKLIYKYGVENVRGGTFCQLRLPAHLRMTLKLMMGSSNNCCFYCLEEGHLQSNCSKAKEDVKEAISKLLR